MGLLSLDTPLGRLTVASENGYLIQLGWGADADQPVPDPVTVAAIEQLRDWFAGRRQGFELPLEPRGTPFQRRVWMAMTAIPYGGSATYLDLAQRLDTGPRAVGTACGRNPLPIVIPCHRVLRSAGLGGYSGGGGLATKRWLLAHEGHPDYRSPAHNPPAIAGARLDPRSEQISGGIGS